MSSSSEFLLFWKTETMDVSSFASFLCRGDTIDVYCSNIQVDLESNTMRSRVRQSVAWTLTTSFLPSVNMSPNAKPPRKGSFFDFLKPRYHEAVFRLRNSVIAVITLATLTHLLPIPTPYASAWKFYRGTFQSPWEQSVAYTGADILLPYAGPSLT